MRVHGLPLLHSHIPALLNFKIPGCKGQNVKLPSDCQSLKLVVNNFKLTLRGKATNRQR